MTSEVGGIARGTRGARRCARGLDADADPSRADTLPGVRLTVLLIGVLLVGCAEETFEFVCQSSVQCDEDGEGVCVEKWCSYPDSGCASGYRFSADADASVAEECVPESALAGE